MKIQDISQAEARYLVLRSQLLDGRKISAGTRTAAADVINRLGYVQIDTLAVVNRSHHHTLWTRLPDYQEQILHKLQTVDRTVFEYWAHAMAYLPMTDYRFYISRMRNFENPRGRWARDRLEKSRHLLEPVLDRIRAEGPQSSQDFAAPSGKKRGSWWDWKPAKMALELLFWRGDLMIAERRNFQKYYDLTERVLPPHIDTTPPAEDETGEFLVNRALSALGIAGEGEIRRFLQPYTARDADMQMAGKTVIARTLKKLTREKHVLPVRIGGAGQQIYYLLKADLEKLPEAGKTAEEVFILSPFDNLIIQRKRLKKLFNFDYALECYLPAAKRRYGYFVMPVLWGNRFAARLDPKADRKKRLLAIQNLVFEPGSTLFDEFLPLFADKLAQFARFNNCEKIALQKVAPAGMKKTLKAHLKTFINI